MRPLALISLAVLLMAGTAGAQEPGPATPVPRMQFIGVTAVSFQLRPDGIFAATAACQAEFPTFVEARICRWIEVQTTTVFPSGVPQDPSIWFMTLPEPLSGGCPIFTGGAKWFTGGDCDNQAAQAACCALVPTPADDGDVNGDGAVDVLDVTELRRGLAGLDP